MKTDTYGDEGRKMPIHEDWRPGQIAFNFVYLANPGLADKIRGDAKIDPFHRDENLDAFWQYMKNETGMNPI